MFDELLMRRFLKIPQSGPKQESFAGYEGRFCKPFRSSRPSAFLQPEVFDHSLIDIHCQTMCLEMIKMPVWTNRIWYVRAVQTP